MFARLARIKNLAGYLAGYIRGYIRAFGVRRCGSTWRLLHGKAGAAGDLVEVRSPEGTRPVVLRHGSADARMFEFIFVWRGYEFDLGFQPRVIFDLGSNIGLSARMFAARYPNARVVAVEPERDNFSLLERNTRGCENVQCIRAAVGGRSGLAACEDPNAASDSFRFRASEEAGDLPMLSMESLIEVAGAGCPDFIKMDIEGAEAQVLGESPMNPAWMSSLRAIAVELHPPFDVKRLRELFPAATWSHESHGETELLKRLGHE